MAYAIEYSGYRGVTAKLYVRFLKPLIPKERYRILGYLHKIRGKVAKTHSEILDEKNNIMAKASAIFILNHKLGGD